MLHVISFGKWEPEHCYIETALPAEDVVTLARIGHWDDDEESVRWLFSVDAITSAAPDFCPQSVGMLVDWSYFFDWGDVQQVVDFVNVTIETADVRDHRWRVLNSTMVRELIASWRDIIATQRAIEVEVADDDEHGWVRQLVGIDRFEAEARLRGLLPGEVLA